MMVVACAEVAGMQTVWGGKNGNVIVKTCTEVDGMQACHIPKLHSKKNYGGCSHLNGAHSQICTR